MAIDNKLLDDLLSDTTTASPLPAGNTRSGLDVAINDEAGNFSGDDTFRKLAFAIQGRESGGKVDAQSPQGALGDMQIMPGTFKQYADAGWSFNNPDQRRRAAVRKLADDYNHFGGDPEKTAAAYLGGRGAVRNGEIRSDVADALGTTPAAYARQVTARAGLVSGNTGRPTPVAPATPSSGDAIDALLSEPTVSDRGQRKVGTIPEVAPAESATVKPDETKQAGLGDAIDDLLTAAKGTPSAFTSAVAALAQGDDPKQMVGDTWGNRAISEARAQAKEVAGMPGSKDQYFDLLGVKVTRDTVRHLPQNLAFSLVSMGASLAAGIPTALGVSAVGTPVAGTVAGYSAGAAAGGTAGYRMDANNFMRDVRDALDKGSIETRGRPMTDDEFLAVADRYDKLKTEHGLYEALPEAIGNVVGMGVGKLIFQAAKTPLKNAALKIGAGVAGELGTELGTEAATQIGQHNVELEAGLGNPGDKPRSFTSAEDWMTSAKEVAPDVLMLTGTMGASAHVAGKAAKALERQPATSVPAAAPIAPAPQGAIPAAEILGEQPAPNQTAAILAAEQPDEQQTGTASSEQTGGGAPVIAATQPNGVLNGQEAQGNQAAEAEVLTAPGATAETSAPELQPNPPSTVESPVAQPGGTIQPAAPVQTPTSPSPQAQPVPEAADLSLQPRDRSRLASTEQMRSIATKPDYGRLGPSRAPETGAPMAFAVDDAAQIPPARLGREDVAVMSDGSRVPFRYAVLDASALQPSHFADGSVNPAYDAAAPGTIKALNNGRAAGLRAAYDQGTAERYTLDLMQDAEQHGIPAEVVANVRAPVLVRLYSQQSNIGDMGAKSQGATLGMSLTEQAAADAGRIDGALLAQYAPTDIQSAGNRDFVRGFIGKLPDAELATMMDADGNLSQDGRRRIEAALMQAAYGDSALVTELFESTDTDIAAIGKALKQVAGRWAVMRKAAESGQIGREFDTTANLVEALNIVRRARAEGRPVAEFAGQGDLMSGNFIDPLTELYLRMFYRGQNYVRARSGDKVLSLLSSYVDGALAAKAGDMFGDTDAVTPSRILNDAARKEDQNDAQPASQAGLFGASGQPTRQADAVPARGERAAAGGEAGQRSERGSGGEAPAQPRSGQQEKVAAPATPRAEAIVEQVKKAKAKKQQAEAVSQPKPESKPEAAPVAAEQSAEEKAKADFDAALGDLGDIFGKNFRANITQEQEQKLVPVLTRMFDAAFRMGYHEFKKAARFVLDTIRSKLGADVADQVTIDHLQGAYIATAGKYEGATSKRDVVSVESLDDLAPTVDKAAHEAATSPQNNKPAPTPAQIEAGNYAKGHVTIAGLDISIENPEGSTRSGTDANGKAWSTTMRSHYGYIRGTVGRDKDHVDVFVKPGTQENYNGPVFVIDQRKPGNGHFDEHKAMIGWASETGARAAYLANYSRGWKGLGPVTAMHVNGFKDWLNSGNTTKRASEQSVIPDGWRAVGPNGNEWAKSVDDKNGVAIHQMNIRSTGAPSVFTLRRSTRFKNGVTGAPSEELGKFDAIGKAVAAADHWLAGRVSPTMDQGGNDNVTDQRSRADLERDRQDAEIADRLGAEGVRAGRPGDGGTGGRGVQVAEEPGRAGSGGSVSGREAAAAGEHGDFEIYRGAPKLSPGSAGNRVDLGSADSGLEGSPVEPDAAIGIEEAVTSRLQLEAERKAQEAAAGIKLADGLQNIRETLPALHEGQQEDVAKTEKRFAVPDGYGMLFTNGTGTGKTFSGLGTVKRFTLRGKSNILIVAPNDKIIEDWQKSGRILGLDIGRLTNTNDAGRGVVITTYANMGQNNELARRDWDLIVHDEAHYLAMDKDGTSTNALGALRAISLHPDGTFQRARMLHADLLGRWHAASADAKALRMSDDERDWHAAAAAQEKADKLGKEYAAEEAKIKADVAARQGERRPRVLFLSATPFAYEKTVDWANGYLFDYNEGRGDENSEYRGYNAGSNRDQFMMQHFGYRMRYNKLTEPDAKVDRGLMQRQFNSWLKKRGALSGRMLDVSADYDRKFVLVDSAIGSRIDAALQWFEEQRKAGDTSQGLSALRDAIGEKFDYLSRRYLLEAIKAQEVIPHIREHLALGRKVVVFHDYKKGGGFNPFDVHEVKVGGENADQAKEFNEAVRAFRSKFKDLIRSDVFNASSPITAFQREFPGVLLFNGDVPAKTRRENVAKFNDDATGPQVILVQSAAGKEGISLHDTTGKHQRVLFNLGQPTQPTTAIQQEGRIYRTGQVTDAIFRYLNTGTNWEKWAFATTIAQRASAAENLGMGELARALKDAFISGFEESGDYRAGMEGEGKGGKERDRAANEALTEFDRARAFYFGTQKKNSKTKAQDGVDYFATPEPVGLKMMEWASIGPGESVLEPSAGHGAIARWAPESAERTAIEPSMALRARLAMVFDGKIIDTDFEDLNIVNKYDAVVMNPPFGSGGKTAIDHVAKAAQHLRDGGRIVALIPTGPAADKRFEKWFYEEDSKPVKPLGKVNGKDVFAGDKAIIQGREYDIRKVQSDGQLVEVRSAGGVGTFANASDITEIKPTGKRTESFRPAAGLYLVADIKLPTVTFERAGTQVATRIVVIEKQTDAAKAQAIQERTRDLSDVDDINKLFDRIENLSLPERAAMAKEAPEEAPATKRPTAPAIDTEAAKAAADALGLPIVEHTTQKGKVIRGVVRTDLSRDQAKAIDEFTFKKDGGWFIREKHLAGGNAEGTKLSRGSGSGMARRDAQAVIDRIAPTFRNLPQIHLLDSPSQAPKELQADIKKLHGWNDAEAAFHNGEFYLFLNHLADEARLEHALFKHEVRHYGLDNVFGDRKDALLGELWRNSPGLQVKAYKLKQRLGLDSNIAAIEEVLADMPAEDMVKLKGWHKVALALRDWLQAHGYEKLAARMTDLLGGDAAAADLMAANMIRQAQDYAKSGAPSGRLIRGTRLAGGDSLAVDQERDRLYSAGGSLFNDDILLEFEKPITDSVLPNIAQYNVFDARSGEHLGEVALVVRDGVPKMLADIKAATERAGMGERVVKALAATADETGLYVYNILPKAYEFWAKMGTAIEHDGGYHNGTLFYDEYRSARAESGRGGEDSKGHARLSRAKQAEPAEAAAGNAGGNEGGKTPLTRAQVSAKADEFLARPRGGESIINTTTRAPVQAARLDQVTRYVGGKVRQLLDAITPDDVKAGLIADYGLPEAVTDRRDLMFGHQRAQLRKVESTLERLSTLTRQESRVAYEWMNNRNADHLLEWLPEDSRALMVELKNLITDMGKEAVRLGQLDGETFKRHELAYLHRSYKKHDIDQTAGERQSRARAIRVMGDQYKGRGIVDSASMKQVQNVAPEFWKRKVIDGKADAGLKGETFLRLERRQNRGEGAGTVAGVEETGQLGKLLEVNYWPASEPLPAKYGAWHQVGKWEVRGTKGDKLILWRDFTRDERERMGELDEVRYAVAKTLHQMIHDIEVGKYLSWLAGNYGQRAEDLPHDAKVVEAKESMRNTFAPDEWVKVSDGLIPGTQTKRFGTLAGLYVPGPIWNDVRQTTSTRYAPLGQAFASLMKAWKVSKTALSPAVHLNNVMANFVMADWHDIRTRDLTDALKILARPDEPMNREIIARFEDSAATQGTYMLSEVQREQLAPLIEALEKEIYAAGEVQGMVGLLGAWEAVKAKSWREILPALNAGKGSALAKTAVRKMMDIYQSEDTVFRLAAFLKAKGEGANDMAAGKFARRSFLDYQINAPWVQAMRSTALPFISFTYRAVPMLLHMAEHKPWKLMKLALAAGALNAIGYAISGGDEDKERKFMPKEKAGRVWGLVPKLIRMPWNDKNGSPVFLDIRRFIPVGDIVDFGQEHSAIPIPPAMMPGGPLALLGELIGNTSMFTGQDITKSTDTAVEKVGKVLDYIYKSFAPNIIALPGTYAFKNVADAGTGKTDVFGREQSVPMAVASGFGLKVGAYPTDVLRYDAISKARAEKAEIDSNIRRLGREYQRGGLSLDQYRGKVESQVEKQREVLKEVSGR